VTFRLASLVLSLALLLAPAASEAGGLAFGKVGGPKGPQLKGALKKGLCKSFACVDDEGDATVVLTASTSKTGKKWFANVSLAAPDGEIMGSKKIALSKSGVLPPAALGAIRKWVGTAIKKAEMDGGQAAAPPKKGGEDDAPPPMEKKEKKPPVAADDDEEGEGEGEGEEEKPKAKKEKMAREATDDDVREKDEEDDPPPAKDGDLTAWPIFAVEVGARAAFRQLEYLQLASTDLVAVRPGLPGVQPFVKIELTPLARLGGFAGGFGVEAEGAMLVGQKLRARASGQTFDENRIDAQANFGWRSPPIGGVLRLRPFGGARLLDNRVPNGPPGLPDVSYRAWQAGLGLDLHLGRVRIFARGAYQGVLQVGELQAYFPRVRSVGYQGGGGLAFRVHPLLELTAHGRFEMFLHTLNPQPGDLYVARFAADAFVVAGLGARLTL
jgi:hypothetical protein